MAITINRRKLSSALQKLLERDCPTNWRYDNSAPSYRIPGQLGRETLDFSYRNINLVIDCATEQEVVAEYMAAIIGVMRNPSCLSNSTRVNVIFWLADNDWQAVTMAMTPASLRKLSGDLPANGNDSNKDITLLLQHLRMNVKLSRAELTLLCTMGNIQCSDMESTARKIASSRGGTLLWLLKEELELAKQLDKRYARNKIVLERYSTAE